MSSVCTYITHSLLVNQNHQCSIFFSSYVPLSAKRKQSVIFSFLYSRSSSSDMQSAPGFHSGRGCITVILGLSPGAKRLLVSCSSSFPIFRFSLSVLQHVNLGSGSLSSFFSCSSRRWPPVPTLTSEQRGRGNKSPTFPLACLLSTLRYAQGMKPNYFETLEVGKYSTQELCNLQT